MSLVSSLRFSASLKTTDRDLRWTCAYSEFRKRAKSELPQDIALEHDIQLRPGAIFNVTGKGMTNESITVFRVKPRSLWERLTFQRAEKTQVGKPIYRDTGVWTSASSGEYFGDFMERVMKALKAQFAK